MATAIKLIETRLKHNRAEKVDGYPPFMMKEQ
jgi:hypothetical protein